MNDDDQLGAVRGIFNGLAISAVLWLLILAAGSALLDGCRGPL